MIAVETVTQMSAVYDYDFNFIRLNDITMLLAISTIATKQVSHSSMLDTIHLTTRVQAKMLDRFTVSQIKGSTDCATHSCTIELENASWEVRSISHSKNYRQLCSHQHSHFKQVQTLVNRGGGGILPK